jgi:hypothetical protein
MLHTTRKVLNTEQRNELKLALDDVAYIQLLNQLEKISYSKFKS